MDDVAEISGPIDGPQELMALMRHPPRLPGGHSFSRYDVSGVSFTQAVTDYLIERGHISQPVPLEDLHLSVSPESQVFATGSSRLTVLLAETTPTLRATYQRLVQRLSSEVFGTDLVFERNPVLRFHFPGRMPDRYRGPEGTQLSHHSDTLLGDDFEMANCWLPLTRCYGSNALQMLGFDESVEILSAFAARLEWDPTRYVEARRAFYEELISNDPLRARVLKHSRPASLNLGEVMMFDPRTLHGTAENLESHTRVSIDFRVLTVDTYEAIQARLRKRGAKPLIVEDEPLVKGGYYESRTIGELCG